MIMHRCVKRTLLVNRPWISVGDFPSGAFYARWPGAIWGDVDTYFGTRICLLGICQTKNLIHSKPNSISS